MEKNPTILIVDALTDKVIERELNDDEKAAHKALCKATEVYQAMGDAKAVARENALSKLADLGLTAEEIAAI
jgi:signal transduction histidine kinase